MFSLCIEITSGEEIQGPSLIQNQNFSLLKTVFFLFLFILEMHHSVSTHEYEGTGKAEDGGEDVGTVVMPTNIPDRLNIAGDSSYFGQKFTACIVPPASFRTSLQFTRRFPFS
jgi:hypothetical protein